MQQNILPVESYKKLYDGDYEYFNKFSEEIKSLLRPLNSLSGLLLDDTISVVKMKRGPSTNYQQSGKLTTSLQLLHSVIRSYKGVGKTDLIEITKDALEGCPSSVRDVIQEIITDTSESQEKERMKTPEKFYSKCDLHPTGKLTEEIPWGELIEAVETDENYEFREANKLWATHELDLLGGFRSLSKTDQGKILRTGTISRKQINEAIAVITDVVHKKLSDTAKEISKLHDENTGQLKDGYEIYKILSTPTTNEMKNLIITASKLFSDRGTMTSEQHLRETFRNCRSFERAIKSLNTDLEPSYIIGLGNWIRQFPKNDANEQALKTDVLSKDICTLTKKQVIQCAQIRSPLDEQLGSNSSVALYFNHDNDILEMMFAGFAANSSRIKCFACGQPGHLARTCPNTEALDKWKAERPEQYKKFGKRNIKCKFGKNCNRRNKGCPFKHPSNSGEANNAQGGSTNDNQSASSSNDPEVGISWLAQGSDEYQGSECGKSDGNVQTNYSSLPWRRLRMVLTFLVTICVVTKYAEFNIVNVLGYYFLLQFVLPWLTGLPQRDFWQLKMNTDLISRFKGAIYPCYIAELPKVQSTKEAYWHKKLILDSGANFHMTGNKSLLHNLRGHDMIFNTANGSIRSHEKGDISDTIKNVIHNPALDTTLISVFRLCSDNPEPTGILFTKTGAWKIDPSILTSAQQNSCTQIASNVNGTYTILPKGDLKDIKTEKDVLTSNALRVDNYRSKLPYNKDKDGATHPNKPDQREEESPHDGKTYLGSHDVIQHNLAYNWHQRLGHPSDQMLEQLVNAGWIQIPNYKHLKSTTPTIPCEGCLRGAIHNHKHKRKDTLSRNANRANNPGDSVHMDIMWLPLTKDVVKNAPPGSMLKNKLALVAVDSNSDWSWILFLKDKSSATLRQALTIIIAKLKSENHMPKQLMWDGEKGIWDSSLQNWLYSSHAIVTRLTSESQQNLAENKIKRLRHIAKHNLKHRHLSVDYVHDAFRYANTILCLLPKSRLGGRTSYQEYLGKNPSREINRLRTFGSICYFHERSVTSHKHDSTKELIFVGFNIDEPYRAIDPRTQGRKIISSWHAIFDETKVPLDWLKKITASRLKPVPIWTDTDPDDDNEPLTFNPPPASTSEGVESDKEEKLDHGEMEERGPAPADDDDNVREPSPPRKILPQRSTRGKLKTTWSPTLESVKTYPKDQRNSTKPSTYIAEAFLAIGTFLSCSMIADDETKDPKFSEAKLKDVSKEKRDETLLRDTYPKAWGIKNPKSIKSAQKSPYWPEWEKAIEVEIRNLMNHDTFTYEDTDRQRKLGTKFVFVAKHDKEGNITKFKARLVAKGYEQIHLLHYDKTFAPVAYMSSILMLLVISVTLSLSLFMMDFKGAFLHSLMPKEYPVYIETPYGMHCPPNRVIRLNKSLYGTKNAGHLWWEDLKKLLISEGFTQSTHDQCVFYRRDKKTGTITLLATWVDDVLVCSNDPDITNLKRKLEKKKFQISTFEKLEWFLGISIEVQEDGSIILDQSAYIEHLLNKFSMTECHTVSTPISHNELNQEDVSPKIDTTKVPYRGLVGGLSHLARFTRSDILYAVFYFARFQKSPNQAHWKGLKRILRYLKGTKDVKIHIRHQGKEGEFLLEAFVDADWATAKSDYKSTSGYCIKLNGNNVMCVSRKQKATAQSSCEAELYAAGVCTMDLIWARNILEDILSIKFPPTKLYCDNQAVIDNVKGDKNSKRLKHCMVKLNLLRDHNNREISLQKVHTKENTADIFTKVLHRGPFEYLRGKLLPNSRVPQQHVQQLVGSHFLNGILRCM